MCNAMIQYFQSLGIKKPKKDSGKLKKMGQQMKAKQEERPKAPEISDEDIYEAMKEIDGYLDISLSDFRELYLKAYSHATHRYEHSVKAIHIMTREVISVGRETGLIEVAELLAKFDISGIPVVTQDMAVIGVISEKDFLRRMVRSSSQNFMSVIAECLSNKGCLASGINAEKAGDIMASPAIICHTETPLFGLSALMNTHKINRLPVTDEKNRLMGIISRTDLVRAYTLRTNQ